MQQRRSRMEWSAGVAGVMLAVGASGLCAAQPTFEFIGRYESGLFDEAAAEICAFDPVTQRVFFVNGSTGDIDVLNFSDPTTPTLAFSIDLSPFGGGANSVAFRDGILAAAVEADEKTDPGSVVLFDADGAPVNSFLVGALPDMVTFTPDGNWLLCANEGEPNDDYSIDPEGSIGVIDISMGPAAATQSDVRLARFTAFNEADLDGSVRIFGPGASVAQDLEPEYIAVSADSRYAYVTLQENNAIAAVDILDAKVFAIAGLGFKDHLRPGFGLDASDRDGVINIANWPVRGMFLPDAITSFVVDGQEYLLTANEGDAREYDTFVEEERIKDLTLDPVAFPDAAALQEDKAIGRLAATTVSGDTDGDGDFDELYVYGGRSVTLITTDGRRVWDSGDALERIVANFETTEFNSNNDENGSFDSRSDAKGPEPEAVITAEIDGRTYAFIGLERQSAIVVLDLTTPTQPRFTAYLSSRDFTGDAELGTAGDLGPEGLLFINAADSPTGSPLLVVGNEVSGSVSVWEINDR